MTHLIESIAFLALLLSLTIGALANRPNSANRHVTTRKLSIDKEKRIIGGQEAEDERYSYAVYLQTQMANSTHTFLGRCGGSLIAKDVVLTAAHCVDIDDSESDLKLVAAFAIVGRNDISNNNDGEVIEVDMKKTVIHPKFSRLPSCELEGLDYDFALLYLTKAAPSYTKLVQLNKEDSYPDIGVTSHVVGWGDTNDDLLEKNMSNVLQEVDLAVISNDECRLMYIPWDSCVIFNDLISAETICAYSKGKDSCQGDSGGPLVIRGNDSMGAEDVQIGVVSWGFFCNFGAPGVYGRVSSVYNWIKNNVCSSSKIPPPRFSCGADDSTPKPTTKQPTPKPISKQPSPRPTPPPQQPTQEAKEDRYSYAVSLLKVIDGNGYHFCGGSLIAKDVILTAGHCVEDIDKNVDVVVALIGRHEFGDSDGELVQVNFEMSISHPFYNNLFADEFEYDFALLYLAVPTNANVKIVKLNQEVRFPKGFSTAYALGWGSVGLNLFNDDDSLVNFSESLQEVEQTVIINAACRTTKNTVTIDGEQIEDTWEDKISDHMLCTLPSEGSGSDACTGDGGGPLVILGSDSMGGEDIQVGVASWGLLFCGLAPNVYSRVSSAYSWIKADICQYSQAPPEYLCETPSPTPRPTTRRPTPNPTNQPTRQPSHMPTSQPTHQPTLEPSNQPTKAPSVSPTDSLRPSVAPSLARSQSPSHVPTSGPSASTEPSYLPSSVPSSSYRPTTIPSHSPSILPSTGPSLSTLPTYQPSSNPTTTLQTLSQPSSLPSFSFSNKPNSTQGEETALSPDQAAGDENAPPEDSIAGDAILIDSSEIVIESEKSLEEDVGGATASTISGATVGLLSADGAIIIGSISFFIMMA